jgi:phosphate:Na+ symporter
MTQHSIFILILGGTALFLFGMGHASENLQSIAANRIRDLLTKLTNHPILGIFSGILITLLMQSSGAVTSMLVGLGTAGVVTLPQVMSIILGAGVGSTVTTQLLSLNIAQFGLPIFAVSFSFYFLTHRKTVRRAMAVFMGFGMMFWGLELIGLGSAKLKEAELFTQSIAMLRQNPFLMMIITAIVTATIHSSAAIVGIAMSLCASGIIDLSDSFYWVYGANIGTTATALMAASGGNNIGRQVAWAHALHKVCMVLIFYFLTPFLASWISTDSPVRDVANAHLLFNVLGAILFYPFINSGARLVERMIPPNENEKQFSVKYLARSNFESPSVVLAHAEREVLRMADLVMSMIRDSIIVLRSFNPDMVTSMRERDNKVDLLNREIAMFITRFMDRSDGKLHNKMVTLFSFASDLESAADVIDNSILDLADKKHALKVDFSPEGWAELEKLHEAVMEASALAVSSFQIESKDLAEKVVHKKREIREMEKQMRELHIARLVQGRKESINTSAIHLDVLSDFRRVIGLMANHMYSIAPQASKRKTAR